jgi:hypothetical protein
MLNVDHLNGVILLVSLWCHFPNESGCLVSLRFDTSESPNVTPKSFLQKSDTKKDIFTQL